MKRSKRRFVRVLTVVGAALLAWIGGKFMLRLPTLSGRSQSVGLEDTANTRLGQSVVRMSAAHPGVSGVFPLPDGRDAFAARALLADAAERTLDVQYYIWQNDMSGTLLFDALRRAADRGVRVRLLLDDNNTSGLDNTLAALDAHPNIEVRLFNPFTARRWRGLGYLTDFPRLNRRMHNKSFTADNQVTIIGGRNIGDEYFGASQDVLFIDLDVMAIGPVVNDVSHDFDRYWSSGSSYPAGRLLAAVNPATISSLGAAAASVGREPAALAFMQRLAQQPFVREVLAGALPFEWAAVRMVSDDPAKGLGLAAKEALLPQRLKNILGEPRQDLQLVSPYFVPTAAGVEYLAGLAEQQVKITVLTNSLEATDVAVVHAGYAKRRKALLKAGIDLFEMKRTSPVSTPRDRRLTGSSGSSLHAKTFSVDRSRVFIGSFNFDPRSAQLNTEMGFVIDSPVLAKKMADAIARGVALRAFHVRLSETGKLQWVEQVGKEERVHDQEPRTAFGRRVAVFVLSLLPIEWLL